MLKALTIFGVFLSGCLVAATAQDSPPLLANSTSLTVSLKFMTLEGISRYANFKDAYERAKEIAASMGVRVGGVISVVDEQLGPIDRMITIKVELLPPSPPPEAKPATPKKAAPPPEPGPFPLRPRISQYNPPR